MGRQQMPLDFSGVGAQIPMEADSSMLIGPTARSTDPGTSRITGAFVAEDSPPSINAVAAVMLDGKPRLDEEIHKATVEAGLRNRSGLEIDSGRIRHGRLWLERNGYIILTGMRRPTKRGGSSREWVWNAARQWTPLSE